MKNALLHYTQRILPLIVVVFLLSIVYFTQKNYDNIVHPTIDYNAKISKYILPATIIKNFSFGFTNVIADYYWISIIQDFAGWDRRTDNFYLREYENLTKLDSTFEYPYLFGILTVSKKEDPKSSKLIEPIAQTGVLSLPYNWEIPYYMATQFHLAKNYLKAKEYIQIAASRPIIPDAVQRSYEKYNKDTTDSTSQDLINTIYETTHSETTKKIIKQGEIIAKLIQVLQPIVENYKTRYGTYPNTLADMVEKNVLKVEPTLEKEFTISINPDNGKVTVTPRN